MSATIDLDHFKVTLSRQRFGKKVEQAFGDEIWTVERNKVAGIDFDQLGTRD